MSLEAGRGIPCRSNPAATLLVANNLELTLKTHELLHQNIQRAAAVRYVTAVYRTKRNDNCALSVSVSSSCYVRTERLCRAFSLL